MLVIGIGVFSLSFLLDPPHSPEHWSSDLLTAHFSQTAESQNQNIILVYISESTLADKPYLSPIDREVVAKLVSAIDQAGAKVIGLDLILDRETESAKDRKLIDTIQQARAKIVLGVVDAPEGLEHLQFQSNMLGELGLTPKCKRVTADSHVTCGHIYFGEHRSNLVLGGYVVRFIEDKPFFSFGNAVATAASGKIYPAQSWTISWLLPPRDGSENFTTFDARSLLGAAPLTRDLTQLINGKIVLIGGNFKDRDRHFIPLSITDDRPYPSLFSHFTRFFDETNGQRYPGLFIHAQFIAQILDDRGVIESFLWITLFIVVSFSLLAYVLGQRSGHRHLWLELGGVVSLCLTTILLFRFGHFIFPLAYAAFAWIIAAAVGHYGNPVEKKVAPC
jgi:CHASE2 domain-containing sensor protein